MYFTACAEGADHETAFLLQFLERICQFISRSQVAPIEASATLRSIGSASTLCESPSMPDYDDPETEARWNAERRTEVLAYFEREGIAHADIADAPAWSVAPYASIWAVASRADAGAIGWWAISGDLPTDYVSSDKAATPRQAVSAIASLWVEAAQYMERGEPHPTFIIGTGDRAEELAPMLASRAALLLEWVDDPEAWEP